MRILFVTAYYQPAFVYGGPVRSIATLCEGLVRAGVSVTVFTTNANGTDQVLDVPTDQAVCVNGVDVWYFALAPSAKHIPFYSPTLGQACRAQIGQFDAAYLYGTWTYPMLAGGKAAQAAGVPYVISPRGAFMTRSLQEKQLKKRLYYWLVERNLLRRAAAIHCTSNMEQQQLAQLISHPSRVLIANGLDLTPFAKLPSRGMLRAQLGLSSTAQLSIFAGRLAAEKRLDLTLEAFAEVAQQMPEAHLALIGPEAGCGPSLYEQIKWLNLQNRVHFVGALTRSELLQAYADADLLVLLSRRENFGMVVVEAMAAGLPVLLSSEVGVADQVAQAGAGHVVSSSSHEIAQVWRQMLMVDDSERQKMGKCGQALAQQHFSQEITAAQMLTLLQRISKQTKVDNLVF